MFHHKSKWEKAARNWQRAAETWERVAKTNAETRDGWKSIATTWQNAHSQTYAALAEALRERYGVPEN